MKNIKFAGFILFLVVPLFVAAQAPIKGFRGIEWGTHKDSIRIDGKKPLFIRVAAEGDDYYYTLDHEDLSIGTADLQRIYYVFDADSLFYIVVLEGDTTAVDDMEFILLNRLGTPDNFYRNKMEFLRYWNVGGIDVVMTEQKSGDFTVEISSNKEKEAWIKTNRSIQDF